MGGSLFDEKPGSVLGGNQQQAEEIVDLIAVLRRLPKEALLVPHMKMTGHVGCITSMNHPAWEPLRKEAKQLLQLLEPAIQRNETYFQKQ
jgi:hypothetical protein